MDDITLLKLPDDPTELKRIVAQQQSALELCDLHIEDIQREAAEHLKQRDGVIAQRDGVIAQRDTIIEQIKREAAERLAAMQQQHKAELDAVLRRFYGPRSERFDPTQLLLFGIAVAEQLPVDARAVEAETGQKLVTRRINHHRHGRQQLPAHLPRVEIPHDLTDEQKKCPCCGEVRQPIGTEVSEQLEFVSASFQVLKHVRHKYACKTCGQGCCKCDGQAHIEIATKTPQPIEKGLPGPGLLGHIITSKLGDHLPLYRLEHIFARSGVEIARSTMCAWMLAASELVKPLTDLMAQRVKQSKVVHTDDTRVPVQDEQVKGKCKSGRIWAYLGDLTHPYDVYEYTPDRTRAGPQRFLAEYKGYLQADAYGGYDGVYHKGDCVEVACWAHARRKFFDAKDTDGRRAVEMLAMVRELYAVEEEAKALDDEHRRERRQQKSVPILAKIKTWLEKEKELVLPRSPMAGAIGYALNQWQALCRYVEQGFLDIDNNAAERAMKRIAIGRKNWLFAGNDAAAQSHARLYTLIASAERHGVDPQRYLTSILAKIGQTPLSELVQFLPEVWKAEDVSEAALHTP
jgi:transposase